MTSFVIPLVCSIWYEDGVWNATAEGLAVAVFGSTQEEADKSLRIALREHVNELARLGLLKEALQKLKDNRGRLHLASADIAGRTIEFRPHSLVTLDGSEKVLVA